MLQSQLSKCIIIKICICNRYIMGMRDVIAPKPEG